MVDDTSPVWVEAVEHHAGERIALGHGRDEDGAAVAFAGEPRPLHAVWEALAREGEPVRAITPAWPILSRGPTPAA